MVWPGRSQLDRIEVGERDLGRFEEREGWHDVGLFELVQKVENLDSLITQFEVSCSLGELRHSFIRCVSPWFLTPVVVPLV